MQEELIERVTREVLRCLNEKGLAADVPQKTAGDCHGRLLVLGGTDLVTEQMLQGYMVCEADDYKQTKDILRYDRVIVNRLTLTQLSDIALARDASLVSCAVLHALLEGIEVCLLEEGLPHLAYAGKTATRLYEVIEENVRTVQTYGVKLIAWKRPEPVREAKPAKFAPPPRQAPVCSGIKNNERLITEALAQKLVKEAGGCEGVHICIAKDAIVTPSAWDVFHQFKACLKRDE